MLFIIQFIYREIILRLLRYSIIFAAILITSLIGFHYKGVKSQAPLVENKAENKEATNIYAYANANMLAETVRNALWRVYVPNSLDSTISVIDPITYTVVDTFKTGKLPEHVVPSYDLKTLWILNEKGNTVTPIDPLTAKSGTPIKVDDPYNLYFTPDGRYAIVVREGHKMLDFRDAQTMALHDSVPIECRGANHMDFTADGKFAIVTCEFSSQLFKLDIEAHKVIGYLTLSLNNSHMRSMPQDIRSTADGRVFYVADMMMNGVFLIDPINFKEVGFIPTGVGTHSVYPSRDGSLLYVANRGCMKLFCPPKGPGGVTVIDPVAGKVIATWPIPGGGSPDMGNVSADGKELWLSGRYDREVYVFDTSTGQLLHRIKVGRGPHGLTVWPQPGRYSLGHTGNMR